MQRYRGTLLILCIWTALYLADADHELMSMLSGVGVARMDGAWYRLFTGVLLHENLLHLAGNALGLFYISRCLEPRLGTRRYLATALALAVSAQTVYLCMFAQTDRVFGGSILNFSLLGLLAAGEGAHAARPGTAIGNTIWGYAVLANLPLLPFMSVMTLVLHAVSFAVGLAFGMLGRLKKRISRKHKDAAA